MGSLSIVKKKLNSEEKEVVLEGVKELANFKPEIAIPNLILVFKHPMWIARKTASEIITSKFGKAAVAYLKAGLAKDHNEDLRYWSIRTLGDIKSPEATQELANLYNKEKDYKIREHIIRAIGNHMSPVALTTVIKALGDEVWTVRQTAAQIIEENFAQKAIPYLEKAFKQNLSDLGDENIAFWSLKLLARFKKENFLPVAKALLASKDNNKKMWAIVALGEIKSLEAIKTLVKAFDEDSWLIRRLAADILKFTNSPEVDGVIKEIFSNTKASSEAKYWGLKVLAARNKEKILPTLAKLMNSQDPDMRLFALEAVSEIDSPESLKLMIKAFKDKIWTIRERAATLLILKREKAFNLLVEQLQSADEDMVYWSLQALSKLGKDAINYLSKALEDDNERIRYYALTAISNIKTDEVIPILISRFKDPKWGLRAKAADILFSMGKKVIKPLIMAFLENNPDIHYWAGNVLNRFGSEAITEISLLLDSEDLEERKAAVLALSQIRGEEALRIIVDVLENGDPEECEIIVKNLSGMNSISFVKLLLEYVVKKIRETEKQNIEEIPLVEHSLNILSEVGPDARSVVFELATSPQTDLMLKKLTIKVLSYYLSSDVPDKTFKVLLNIITNRKENTEIRKQAAEALLFADFDTVAKFDQLLMKALLSEPDTAVASYLLKTMGNSISESEVLKKSVLKYLLSFHGKEIPESIKHAIMDIENNSFLATLLDAYLKFPKYRNFIIELLKIAAQSASKRQALLDLADRSDPEVTAIIYEILVNWPEEIIFEKAIEFVKTTNDSKIVAMLIKRIAPEAASNNNLVRGIVNKKLPELGPKITEGVLLAMKESDDFVKMTLEAILETVGQGVVEELEKLKAKYPDLKPLITKLLMEMRGSLASAPTSIPQKEEKTKNEAEEIMKNL